MSDIVAFVESLNLRGIHLTPNLPNVTVEPASKLTDSDRAAIRRNKAVLLAFLCHRVAPAPDPAATALSLLGSFKGFTLPSRHMPTARLMIEGMRGLCDPASILSALQSFEAKLVAMGGRVDPDLCEAAHVVERIFPGAKLITVKPTNEASRYLEQLKQLSA